MTKKISVLGVNIDPLTKSEALAEIRHRLRSGEKTFIVTPYSESLVTAQKDSEFRQILNSADISLPDGIGVLWAAKYLESRIQNHESRIWTLAKTLLAILFRPSYIRIPIPEKISGSEFVWDLAGLAAENGYSIFLLGGFGDTAERAADTLKAKIPNLRIAGVSNTPDAKIEGDLLFVALGPVRQEKWIARHLPKLPIKLAIGLGGTFDYLAKKRPYRPKFWATRGLEWLFRLLTQPWRAIRIFKGVLGLIFLTYNYKQKSRDN